MSSPPFASLYVGDLPSDVTEGMLFDTFNPVGSVASIRVCRDTLTRRSLGYAYVNFHNAQDAERALDTLNNAVINGRACRIMWSQRDPSLRRSGVGNIFIKNLDPTITHKELYDTFSAFGNILSCKVQMTDKGDSKGFGFVHFESQESADSAIQKVNGMLLGSKEVYVAKFLPKKERAVQKGTSWSNIYVKELDTSITEAQLNAKFEPFGKLASVVVMKNPDGSSKGFGFVSFEQHDDAVRAVETLNGTEIGSKKVWCGPAQKKAEREQELRAKFRVLKLEQMTKYSGFNLYIKNLEDDLTEERLRKEFSVFGTIKSVKIMLDERGASKGFGFVCFSTPDEAQRAIGEMNSRILQGCTKPLYVALHEPKEVRRHKLLQRQTARSQGVRSGAVPSVFPPQQVFYPGVPAAYYYAPNQVMPRGGAGGASGTPSNATPTSTGSNAWATVAGGAGSYPAASGSTPSSIYGQNTNGSGGPRSGPRGGQSGPRGGGGGNRRSNNTGRRGPPQQQQGVQEKPAENQSYDITIELLQNYPPDQQKMILGERLYPLIHKHQPVLSGKITGMLLDSGWSNEDLLTLIKEEEKLLQKIGEAVDVLERAQAENYQ